MNRITVLVVASTALLGAFGAGPAGAHPQLVAESKKQGFPAQNCQYCHVSKTPSKSTYKPDDLNDRGKWMMTEKDKQKAKDVKAEWLKDYPGGKEQK
jgi:hypothetical protein